MAECTPPRAARQTNSAATFQFRLDLRSGVPVYRQIINQVLVARVGAAGFTAQELQQHLGEFLAEQQRRQGHV